jgi:hypothetical protein
MDVPLYNAPAVAAAITNNSAAAMESGYDIAANLAAAFELFPQHKTSAATPDSAAEGPNPGNPPTGLGHLTSECPGCYDFACPGPHPTSPGASPVSQPAAAAVPGEAVGAVESSSGDGADWPLGELLKESGRLLWAYGIGEASEYTMHLAMQLRTAALRISDTE